MRTRAKWTVLAALIIAAVLFVVVGPPNARAANVLLVGTYNSIPGPYNTIQAAVDVAQPGDWILVGPGDYHEEADHSGTRGTQPPDEPAGVVVVKSGIHIRGMDRNAVVVDGTKPGAPQCSSNSADQDFGIPDTKGNPLGRNGIMVWKVDDVSIENLTVCNFLAGGDNGGWAGNEIWWNGGDGSGTIGMNGFHGAYLTATSTFYQNESTAATYGFFVSNSRGPGDWEYTYASNFNDSGYYPSACQQQCNVVIDHAWAEYNAVGYSGSNSGGNIVVKNSEFDNNQDGFDTNSQDNSDWPSPQSGACPNGGTSSITHTHSCWVFMDNYVHDNNNPNVPSSGAAAAGPVGTGMSISGGRDDTIMDNTFAGNGAWGIIFVPYPDTETPPPGEQCQGGIYSGPPTYLCLFDDWDNAIIGNKFTYTVTDNVKHDNGWFGNDTNGDFAELTMTAAPSNCFSGNTDTSGSVSSSPPDLQKNKPACGGTVPPDLNPPFLNQVVCDSQFFSALIGSQTPCLPGSNYPRRAQVVMHPLPPGLQSMTNPCAGVPTNAWCPSGSSSKAPRHLQRPMVAQHKS